MNYQPIARPVRVASDLHAGRFEDVDVNLFELYAACAEQSGLISGRTFTRCRIQGPAIMLVSAGVTFDGCNFGDRDGDMRNLVLRPAGPRALGTVPMRDCLHLKSAVTQVGDNAVLVNPVWVDVAPFAGYECIEVDPSEEHAANALRVGTALVGAFAAKEIQKDEVAKMNLTKIGSITTSRTTSPMDAKRDLSKKADELGGTYFVVIAGEKNEKTVHANADVYK